MKLIETKNNIVTINLDLEFLKKFNKKAKSKINYNEYNEFLAEKCINGNQDAIMKTVNIIKNLLVKNGCSDYEEFARKEMRNEQK